MQSSIIAKLLSLLTVISAARNPLTFSELVSQSGLNKSTLHRLLAIGAEEDLVQYDKGTKTYLLGSKVFDLVRGAYDGYDIQAVALGEMTQLYSKFDVNVTLGVPSGIDVVYLRVLESSGAFGTGQKPGMREKMHCSASGKALMAFIPEALLEMKLTGYEFQRYTERTITDAASFRSALSEVRKQGYAVNDREEYEHFLGVSAPVFNYLGAPIAVLNLWSSYPQHNKTDLISWAPDLVASAQKVTGLIGGIPPNPATLITVV